MMGRDLIRRMDRTVVSWVESMPDKIRPFFMLLATLTHPVVWGVILAILVVVAWFVGEHQWIRFLLITIFLLPLEQLFKHIFRRARPLTMYVDNMKFRSYSFPSGHAYSAALVLGMFSVGLYSLIGGLIGLLVAAGLVLLAVTIGISRIYVGAHFPSDVLAGWGLGVIILAILIDAL